VIPIGFSFIFFGRSYSSLLVSPNGFVTFDTTSTQTLLPLGTCRYIAYWATDLNSLAEGANTFYFTVGKVGSRKFVLCLTNVPYAHPDSATETLSVELSLFESDYHIEIYYRNAPATHQLVTVGIQDSPGTGTHTLNAEAANALSNKAISWEPEATPVGINKAAIIGGVVGGVVFIGLALTLWRCLRKRPVATTAPPTTEKPTVVQPTVV
jgi:hypothetical protein